MGTGFLGAPGSLFYTAGPGFRWSILNYGRITNNVRVQDARFQQALVIYENIVLKAAKEVEDALIGFLKAQDSAVNSQKSVDAAQRAVELSIIQYREGAENFQRVIGSQTRLLTEMNKLAETRSSIATNLIAVYKALGGGWEVGEGKPIVSEALLAQMASRTDWGNLLPPAAAAEAGKFEPAASGQLYAGRAPARLVITPSQGSVAVLFTPKSGVPLPLEAESGRRGGAPAPVRLEQTNW